MFDKYIQIQRDQTVLITYFLMFSVFIRDLCVLFYLEQAKNVFIEPDISVL